MWAVKVPFDGVWLYLTEGDSKFQMRVRLFDSWKKADEFGQLWGEYKVVEYTTMKPQEIVDYKREWMSENPHIVKLHRDLRDHGKDWCKKLEKQEWHYKPHTNVYEDTYYFEDELISQQFSEEFSSWVITD